MVKERKQVLNGRKFHNISLTMMPLSGSCKLAAHGRHVKILLILQFFTLLHDAVTQCGLGWTKCWVFSLFWATLYTVASQSHLLQRQQQWHASPDSTLCMYTITIDTITFTRNSQKQHNYTKNLSVVMHLDSITQNVCYSKILLYQN